MGSDDIFKRKKRKRKTIAKIEKKAVLIALEDTKSSKLYFEKLIKDKNLSGKVIIADNIGTNPNKVIEALLEYENKNPNVKFDNKWIVIDRDDYSKNEINGAIKRAKERNICVAISNESYELWLLLHFKAVKGYINRKELNRELKNIFNSRFNIDYNKSIDIVYELIRAYQNNAILNAERLVEMHIKNDGKISPYDNNPLTFIFQLVKYLNRLYDEDNSCNCFPLNRDKKS